MKCLCLRVLNALECAERVSVKEKNLECRCSTEWHVRDQLSGSESTDLGRSARPLVRSDI